MFKELFYPFVKHFTFFNIFQYISFRAVYAAVTALLIVFLLGPRIILMLKRLKAGQEIRDDGPESHLVKAGTPTMGGVLMIIAIVVSILLWQDIRSFYTWLIILVTLGFGLLGFIDDYLKISRKNTEGLRAGFKSIGQIVVSVIFVLILYFNRTEQTTLLYLPFFKEAVLDLSWLYIPFGVFWLVGFSNAVNLTDGLDGLASGLVLLVVLGFTVIAYVSGRFDFADYLHIPLIQGAGELTISSLAIAGACIGFLWFNAYPAEVMMGDTGSQALGGLLAALSMILKKEILLVVIGGVFVMETVSVMIQVLWFKRTGRRVFRMAPIHHHFELSGWAESKVVTRFWIIGGLMLLIGLSTLKIQ